jgi:hypothetical protein
MNAKKQAEIKASIDDTVLRMNHRALDVYLKLLFRMRVKNIRVCVEPFFP